MKMVVNEIIVSGRVQGVGYRFFAVKAAKKYRIKGTVQNLPDATVRIVCTGNTDKMQLFINTLRKGPFMASVDNLSIKQIDTNEEFRDFEIVY